MKPETREFLQRLQKGDARSLARLMTYVDNRHEDLMELMAAVYDLGGHAYRLGVTGPPGAGKSTLVDKLIKNFRDQNKTVGVVAIDPSSPFSGGAVLGDRIRMQDHNADPGVFIRSLGSRGAHGGLSRATRDIVQLLDAYGCDVIIIETVGVGQTELDIMSVAQTTLVVLVPESGDTVQTMKAGLMEIADIFVVNKADREGADRMASELLALSEMYSEDWKVPVLKSVATKGDGLNNVISHCEEHQQFLQKQIADPKKQKAIKRSELMEILVSEIAERLHESCDSNKDFKATIKDFDEGKINPYQAAQNLAKRVRF
ncbi:MAG: methylmalonyl Co-A mutase-associated GTPase MeaB [Deltaproteobacteria bacterium]|nr:methylmalonyl Co-A mutase-associated GTPase MeaB [Deltaproteobacteria bacterium]